MSKKILYKKAVGLSYKNQAVPTISANGEYYNADLIVKLAKRYNIPVVENAELAKALNALEANAEIPEHLYEAVAAIIHAVD